MSSDNDLTEDFEQFRSPDQPSASDLTVEDSDLEVDRSELEGWLNHPFTRKLILIAGL